MDGQARPWPAGRAARRRGARTRRRSAGPGCRPGSQGRSADVPGIRPPPSLVCGGRSSGWASFSFSRSPAQARRVLAARGAAPGSPGRSGPRRRPQLGLVHLQPHHLADAQLHPVQAHRPVVLQVGQHEEQGQVGRRLGGRYRAPLPSVRTFAGFRSCRRRRPGSSK